MRVRRAKGRQSGKNCSSSPLTEPDRAVTPARIPAEPARSPRIQSPAQPCSRQASRRQGSRLLPGAGRHHRLRALAGGQVGAQPDVASARRVGDRQHQRRARVPVPGLGRIDSVPARHLARARAGNRWPWRPRGRRRPRPCRETSRGSARPPDAAPGRAGGSRRRRKGSTVSCRRLSLPVTGIHRTASSGHRGWVDAGDKPRHDNRARGLGYTASL